MNKVSVRGVLRMLAPELIIIIFILR